MRDIHPHMALTGVKRTSRDDLKSVAGDPERRAWPPQLPHCKGFIRCYFSGLCGSFSPSAVAVLRSKTNAYWLASKKLQCERLKIIIIQ